MTREEILQTFSDINYAYNNSTKYDTLKRMLDELTEPCEDSISRKDAINAIKRTVSTEQIKALKRLPSVQPKPKMGHWEQYGYSWEDKFKCSECGKEQPKILCGERIIGHWSDYCPNCGADMRESEDT